MRDRLFSIGTSQHYCGRFLGGSGTLTKRNQSNLPLFLTRPQMSGVCPLCSRKWTPIGNKLWVSEFMSVRDWRKSTAAALAPGGFSIPTPGQPCEKFDIGTLTYINAFVLLSRAHNFG